MPEYILENANGLKAKFNSRGGILMELWVPDRDGRLADVTLGFDAIEQYDEKSPYFGALIGRIGNRVAKGTYRIDGKSYQGAINNGENHLHGGLVGFDKVEWNVSKISGEGFTGLKLAYLSKDGEEGYPGNLDVTVTYKLTDANEWSIEYEAATDKPTVVNLTQHSYFNLAGHDSGAHLAQEMKIESDLFTPVDETLIPTGEIVRVSGTPFDFNAFKPIGQDIEKADTQLERARGYDHNFVLRKLPGEFALAATARDPRSGREMKTFTTEPGVQFYAGNFLDGTNVGKGGATYGFRNGFCLETQHFPDSPNQAHFPSIRLDPGQVYRTKTVYQFGVY